MTRITWRVALAGTTLFALATALESQNAVPVNAQNAALRYWMAFAQMQEASSPGSGLSHEELGAALVRVESGAAPWDETTLGPLLAANRPALDTMVRATMLDTSDWGIDFSLGPFAPVAHLAKARTLARLNTLASIRLASRGESAEAVDHLLAGVRFARHLATGGTLISTLTGWSMLRSTLGAIRRAADAGRLDAAQRGRLADGIGILPEAAFDWDAALRNEGRLLELWISHLREDAAFQETLHMVLGTTAAPSTLPTAAEAAAFDQFIARAAVLLASDPESAVVTLGNLENQREALHPLYQVLVPSLVQVNETRRSVKAERELTMAAVR